MALLFLDSFDHYLDASQKYLSGGTAIAAGRHGNGYTGPLRLAPSGGHARVIVGAAYRFGFTFNQFLKIEDVAIIDLATISTENDGSIKVSMFGGPSASTAADLIRVDQWHYIEVDATVTVAPSGSNWVYALAPVRVRLDGIEVLNEATLGPTTETPDLPSAIGWAMIDLLPNADATIDDLYVCDGSGAAPHNGPLGDLRIDVIRPNAAGAVTEWTPAGAAANWDAVNDLTPDADTTHVSAPTAPLSDLYEMDNVSTADTILGAQLLIAGRRTAEGFAVVAPLVRHGGVTTALPARGLSTSYFYRNRDVFVTMPNGDPLTDANVNALQAGVRRTV